MTDEPANLPATTEGLRRRSFLQPYHVYLILAALDVAMLVVSLSIIHRLRVSYGESVKTNTFWAARLVECVNLGKWAVAVNRPGNDAFLADRDPEISLARQPALLREARAKFDAQLVHLREALAPRVGNSRVDELLTRLDELKPPMDEMVAEAEVIFDQLHRGHESNAGFRMAEMDRRYGQINELIGGCTTLITGIQETNLGRQLAEVESRQRMELVLAGVIILIVVIATMYGTILARRMHQLSTSLEKYQDHLESLVRERTARLEESQERLRLNDRLASIGTLAAGLGHDMNNVLFPVRCRLDSLDAADLDGSARDDVDSVRQSVDYLQQLTDGLRLLALDPEDGDAATDETVIGVWWDEVRPLFLTALPRNATLEGEIAGNLDAVAVAPHRLTQAMFNLVVNAGEASGDGGRVRVWARPAPNGEGVSLGVTDTGAGMSPDVQRQAMDPFFTTKKRGLSTGLGLALVQRVASSAGGVVDIDSAPGRGTTVSLHLPAGQRTMTPATEQRKSLRAVVTVSDERRASFVRSLLGSSGLSIVAGPAVPDRDVLWITDGHGVAIDAVERFCGSGPAGRLIFLGEPPNSWKHVPVVTIGEDGAMNALRRAIGDALESAGATP